MKTKLLLSLLVLILRSASVPAAEVTSREITGQRTVRVGSPVRPDAAPVIRGEVDPGDVDKPQSPGDRADPVLEVQTTKGVYEFGEAPQIKTRLQRKDGRGVDDADVHVVVDDKHTVQLRHGAQGEYSATLDNTPGDHDVEVYSDAVVNGNSIHRATTYFYAVATGTLRVRDRAPVRIMPDTICVPLDVVRSEQGPARHYTISGNLFARGMNVAYAEIAVFLESGDSTVCLTFNRADLVEQGPYTLGLVTVMQNGKEGQLVATQPGTVGDPFVVPSLLKR